MPSGYGSIPDGSRSYIDTSSHISPDERSIEGFIGLLTFGALGAQFPGGISLGGPGLGGTITREAYGGITMDEANAMMFDSIAGDTSLGAWEATTAEELSVLADMQNLLNNLGNYYGGGLIFDEFYNQWYDLD